MNRSVNQGVLDANSHLPMSFIASPGVNTNATTTITAAGAGVFHGFLVVTPGAGAYTATLYDALPNGTLNTSTIVGVLNSTTAAGATSFQWGGDIIFNTGLTLITSQGTAGVIKVLYL